jgi:hypothetical protein
VRKNNKIRVKKKYLIDKGKDNEIYCEIFFIRKQKVILFPKFRENGWVSATSALISVLAIITTIWRSHIRP